MNRKNTQSLQYPVSSEGLQRSTQHYQIFTVKGGKRNVATTSVSDFNGMVKSQAGGTLSM